MKCKNCSANYRARELKCPYCSTTNFLGHIWLAEKTEAELEYERAKQECGGLSRYVIYRILTRILVIEVVVGVLLFLGVVAYFFLSEVIRDLNTNHNIASIEAKMELINEAGVAGVAGWKLGLEKSSVWNIIVKYVN